MQRVLREENLFYRVDERCVVHFAEDEEFERNRVSALTCLEARRYAAVRNDFEGAFRKLDPGQQELKGAIVSMHQATESLCKIIIDSSDFTRLNDRSVQKHIKPMAQAVYESNPAAKDSAGLFVQGLCDWVNATQPYRHGQKSEEPHQPPVELVVAILSAGATYIRWLATLDSKRDE